MCKDVARLNELITKRDSVGLFPFGILRYIILYQTINLLPAELVHIVNNLKGFQTTPISLIFQRTTFERKDGIEPPSLGWNT